MGVFDAFPTTAAVDPDVLTHIEQLGAHGKLRGVVELLPFLPPTTVAAYGARAAMALTAIVSRASERPNEVAEFDQWFRESTYAVPYWPIWDHLRAKPLAPWLAQFPAILAIATCSPSGYVREQAVVQLAQTAVDGSELPFLLLRLNDWVAPVRFVAARAIQARIVPTYARAWVQNLGLLARIRAGGRSDHSWIARPIEALLQAETSRSALEAGLSAAATDVRRASVRIAAQAVAEDLLRIALRDTDPVTSRMASAALCKVLKGRPLQDVLDVMRKGNAAARVLALETTCDHFPHRAEQELRAGLLDAATQVREVARFRWSKENLGALDFAAFYRAEMNATAGDSFVTALRGLAEVGALDDAPVFRAFAKDPRARVREAAILGLGRVDGSRHIDLIEQALHDSNLRVVKAAHRYARVCLGKGRVSKKPRRR